MFADDNDSRQRRGQPHAVDLLAQKVLGELARDAEMDSANSHSYKKAA
jgi:hypothetical protein